MSAKKLFLLVAFPCFLFSLAAYAQVITASLQGVVRDPSGAVIPGANVVVRNTETGATTSLTTGPDGFFLAPALPPGPYTVTVKASGFKTLVSNTIELQVDQKAQVHLTVQVGAVTQTVSVKATAPLLKRTTSDLGQVISSHQIVNLPLNARNSYQLAFLAPGIHGNVTTKFNGFNMSVNGGRPSSTEILIGGIPSSPRAAVGINVFAIFPPVDAVQEFKVQTNNYSAQFGDAGSGIINLIYKSGTNQLHGDVYEFLRNSALDANNFFSNAHGVPLPTFQRSQFGFTVGGPVVIPKLYNGHDKTFFFGDFEGLRQGSGASTLDTVPTAAMRNGDFSGLVNSKGQQVTIYDPTTTVSNGSGGYVRSPFQGNMIPTADINAVSANIAKFWPMPNLPGYVNNFAAAGKDETDINNFDVKVNENANANNRFFVRFSRHKRVDTPPNYFPSQIEVARGGTIFHEIGHDVAVDYTHTFSPSFLTEVRYGFARMFLQVAPVSLGYDLSPLGFPSYIAQNAEVPVFPGIGPANYMSLGNGGPDFRRNAFQNNAFSINNTWIKHTHTLNFGYQLVVDQVNNFEANQADGNFTFDRGITQGPDPLQASPTAGDGFASFLLGVGSGSMTLHSKDVATTSQAMGMYLEDDWRVRPKLTLNLGLRYELQIPRTERYNRMNYFDRTVASPLAGPSGLPNLTGGLVFVGTNGVGRREFSTEWTNFAPRVGFAYQAAKNTVVRGAFGLFYAPAQSMGATGTVGSDGFSSVTPYTGSLDGLTPSDYLSNPFPNGLIYPSGNSAGLLTGIGTSFDAPLPNNKVPYSENWNFGIQQMLPGSILAQASYVGSRGLQLTEGGEGNFHLNQLPPSALALGSALKQSVANPFYGLITNGPLSGPTVPMSYLERPFPQFTGVGLLYPAGASSIYHSFQLKAERRFTSGLTFLVSYTGEKLIDTYSIVQNEGRAGAAIQNIYDLKAERSVSTNDISRLFSFASIYQLPFGRGKRFGKSWNSLTDDLLGGWQLNGILTLQTGFPLRLTTQNTSDSGSNVLRPNYNPSAPGCANSANLSGSILSRINEYFNTDCFTQPAPFTFGNVGRALPNVRAPGLQGLDISMFKNIPLGERFTLQFHAEAFNALNQVQFGEPNQSRNSSSFGVITSQANSPRQMQFALKVLF